MNRLVLAFSIVIIMAGCSSKVCEPLSSQGCECAPNLAGARVCNSRGTGHWDCVCGPGTEAPDEATVRARTTCRRMSLLLEAAGQASRCAGAESLGMETADAWGRGIVVVCQPGGPVVASSGKDGQFGSSDDLTGEECGKIEKFGSLAAYERAMAAENEQVALGTEDAPADADAGDTASLIEYWKAQIAAGSAPRPKGKGKGPAETEVAPDPQSLTDPIGGLYEKKKHK